MCSTIQRLTDQELLLKLVEVSNPQECAQVDSKAILTLTLRSDAVPKVTSLTSGQDRSSAREPLSL